jgi:hypothetical protein
MAWLESLAKRQGANVDELTTSADLEVPLPPEDAKVTGPGYTPGYDTGKKAEPAAPTSPKPEPVKPAANPFMSAPPPPPAPVKAEPPKAEPAPVSSNPFMRAEAAKPAPSEPVKPPVQAAPPPPPPAPAPAPAASTASADDPFGGMDPMAWLESLAKRQGANVDELTTSADLEVPLPPEDAKVTGPGYTPGYDTGKKAEPEAAKSAPPPEPVKPPVQAAPLPPALIPAAPPPPAPVASAAAAADDPFGGMDPMAWLESLAKRQGANVDELTTSADLEVPLPPEDAQVTGPGYTPGYDTGKKAEPEPAKPPVQAAPPQPVVPPQPETIRFDAPTSPEAFPEPAAAKIEDWFSSPEPLGWPESLESVASLETPEPAATASAADDDPFGGLDPMAWLEALAKRQGADPAELVTGGTASVPPPPTTAIPQGPGYTDYSAFTQQPLSGEIETPSMSQAEAERLLGLTPGGQSVEVNPLEEMDPIKWLESLAANEPSTSPTSDEVSIFTASTETPEVMEAETALDWLEQLARETGELPPAPAVAAEDDWLTNAPKPPEAAPVDEASLQAADDREALLGWFAESTPTEPNEPDTLVLRAGQIDDLPPAELPDWLKEQVGATSGEPSALTEKIVTPPVPSELPDWLVASVDAPPASGVLDIETALGESVAESIPPESQKFSTSEIEALVKPGAEVDPWAEALDEEYERKRAGDVSIPDWYQEALERYPEAETATKPEPIGAEAVISPAEPPSWLEGLTAEPEPAEPALAEGIPAWLVEANPDFVAPPASASQKLPVDDWTSGMEVPADLPDWLRPPTSQVAAQPVSALPPVTPPPPPVSRPQPAQGDLAAALRAGRELVGRGAHLDSLAHFEPLINASYELETVIGELTKVVAAQAKSPRARRLLGDAYMRRGDLQKALDTYRSALDQL